MKGSQTNRSRSRWGRRRRCASLTVSAAWPRVDSALCGCATVWHHKSITNKPLPQPPGEGAPLRQPDSECYRLRVDSVLCGCVKCMAFTKSMANTNHNCNRIRGERSRRFADLTVSITWLRVAVVHISTARHCENKINSKQTTAASTAGGAAST